MRWLMGLAVALIPATAQAECYDLAAHEFAMDMLEGHVMFEGVSDHGHITRLYILSGPERWLATVFTDTGRVCYVDKGPLPTLGEAL